MRVHWDEFEDHNIKCPYCGNVYAKRIKTLKERIAKNEKQLASN